MKHDYHLPIFPLYHLSNLVVRLRAGFFYEQVNSTNALKGTHLPILFAHGDKDDFTPTQMTVNMHDAYLGPKRLYLSPGAGHGLAFWTNPQEYDEELEKLLKENGM